MTDTLRALMIRKDDAGQRASLETLARDALMEGDVEIKVEHSTINYKDGLALSGRAPIARRFPMIAGIDLAGTVAASTNPDVRVGDRVIVNGWGLSETHYGGFATHARVKSSWLVPCPPSFTTSEAMAIGTAGYTAMLCVMALEEHGVQPGAGPVLVTGAAGGVGSVAVALLAKLGFTVTASTGRTNEADYLKSLGATEIIDRAELNGDVKAMGKERWAGVVDVAGSRTLANAISMTKNRGAVAACGLAQGMDLPSSVAPFILRAITLVGIDSVYEPRPGRIAAWTRLARDLDRSKLGQMTRHVGLDDVLGLAPDIVAGKVRGRIVVDIATG